jgi:exodeoxyribonuclease VII small subunit
MSAPEPDSGKPKTFEAALAELEEIVRALEAGELTLEESLGKYKAGVGLLQGCFEQLRQAEQQILLLSEDADGKPLGQPLDNLSGELAQGEPRPRARRAEA